MSNIGRPACQLHMQAKGAEPEPKTYDFKMRMIMGDVMEAALMALIEAAGIEIKSKHGKVSYDANGTIIKGEYDIELDDGIYDIKTASPFAFEHKFNADNAFDKIKSNDSFGYVAQGIGYGMGAGKPFKGWIALNKSTGEITFADAKYDENEKEEINDKIQKSILATDLSKPFSREFSDVPEVFYKKETGNRTLGIECSWCDYKHECWPNLEFKRQLPSKGKNPKFVWYTYITDEWREREASNNV
tara:strand:- start:3 stop:737 length:735 start_codon:yes stop_codon:yes gene_type:complete